MDEKQEKWLEQVKIATQSQRVRIVGTFLMFILPIPATIFAGVGMGILLFVVSLSILWLSPYWQPAYALIVFISGNKDLSPILARHSLRPLHYVSLGIKFLFLSFSFYSGIRLIIEKGFCELNPFC